jgi:hypothetical protein
MLDGICVVVVYDENLIALTRQVRLRLDDGQYRSETSEDRQHLENYTSEMRTRQH